MSEDHDDPIVRPYGVAGLQGAELREFEQLVADVESQPGGASFPHLAEAYRRAGWSERARALAALGLESTPELMAGKVALGLALLDLGEIDQARHELASILGDVPAVPADHLKARPQAEAVASEAVDPQTDAEHPIWATPLAEPSTAPLSVPVQEMKTEFRPEEIDLAFESAEAERDAMLDADQVAEQAMRSTFDEDSGESFSASEHPRFATRTMAEILEGQGDRDSADKIRASFDAGEEEGPGIGAESASTTPHNDPARVVARLERWLDNIRREVA